MGGTPDTRQNVIPLMQKQCPVMQEYPLFIAHRIVFKLMHHTNLDLVSITGVRATPR